MIDCCGGRFCAWRRPQTVTLHALHTLKLIRCSGVSTESFKALAEGSCTRLETLELGGGVGGFEANSISCAILRYARTLAFVGPEVSRPLKRFRCYEQLPSEVLRALCRACQNLTEIVLHNVNNEAALKEPSTYCCSLKRLEIYASSSIDKPPWANVRDKYGRIVPHMDLGLIAKKGQHLERIQLEGPDGSHTEWTASQLQ